MNILTFSLFLAILSFFVLGIVGTWLLVKVGKLVEDLNKELTETFQKTNHILDEVDEVLHEVKDSASNVKELTQTAQKLSKKTNEAVHGFQTIFQFLSKWKRKK